MPVETISIPAALLAGLLSFFSPCVIPLIPGYFSYISGYSLDELTHAPTKKIRTKIMTTTLGFVSGFSTVFILMGASAFWLGELLFQYRSALRVSGGILIILFGLHLCRILPIRWLDMDKRFQLASRPVHVLGAFFVGVAFGAGWSPCIGPQLGTILILASNQTSITKGIFLLSIYSLGMAVPFLIMSVFIDRVLIVLARMKWFLKYAYRVAGALLIVVGGLLVTDQLSTLML